MTKKDNTLSTRSTYAAIATFNSVTYNELDFFIQKGVVPICLRKDTFVAETNY